jgi:hypothetical protein
VFVIKSRDYLTELMAKERVTPQPPVGPPPLFKPQPPVGPPPLFKPQPPVGPPPGLPKPPSQDAPLAKKYPGPNAQNKNSPAAKTASARAAYTAGRWFIEIFCCVFVVLAVVWGTIQFFGLFDAFGVSNEPPGLRHKIENDT